MKQFELRFQIRGHIEYVLEDVIATLDCGYASHGNFQILTVWVEADNAVDAAFDTVAKLSGLGVGVSRLLEDFVTRQDIAERASVSREAVADWVRQAEELPAFPDVYNIVGGGIWLWADVNEWLEHLCKGDGMGHPTAMDYAKINAAVQFDRVPPVG